MKALWKAALEKWRKNSNKQTAGGEKMRISKYCIYEIVLFHLFCLAYALSYPHCNEWKTTFFLSVFAALLLILEYLRTRIFASPLLFWYVFWLGTIILGRMHLSIRVYPLFRDWSVKLQTIVLLNTIVFFWLYWLGELSGLIRRDKQKQSEDSRNEMLADLVLALLFIAIIAFCINVIHTGVVPQLTGNANAYRSSFVATRYYQVVSVLRFVLACVPLALKQTSSKTKRRGLIILTALYMLAEMLTGWRGYTLQGMILLLTSALLVSGTGKKARVRNALMLCSAGLVAFIFIIYITVTRDGSFEALEVRAEYAIDTFYLYVAPNFLNFQSCIEKVQPKGYLMYTLESLWGIVLPAWENPLYIWDDVEYSIGAYNVCTYLLEPYCDLGIPGTVLWSSLIALFSGWSFARSRTESDVFAYVSLGIVNITVFMLHNNFFLRSSSFLIWMALSFLISRFSKVRIKVNGEKII